MITISGKSVFGGVSIGKLMFYKRNEKVIKRVHVDDVDAEWDRFQQAKDTAVSQLKGLYDKALEDVARFLDDHFAMNVNQETLEKISKMSGTKLKNLFKEKYGQSITEYTQRKRMNVAETLLLNTKLPIKEIAESVGYTSHSKFSIYYKRYKGKLPSEVRNLACKDHNLKCDYCD